MSEWRFPPELIEQILLHLPPQERLERALICRDWASIVSSSASLEDIRLVIYGPQMSTIAQHLIGSQRQYRNLRILKADLTDYNHSFWNRIGRNLRRLELFECDLVTEVFYSILVQCPRLESLEVKGNSEGNSSTRKLGLPGSIVLNDVRESLRNVRHLSLHTLDVTEEVLDHFLGWMPYITSLRLNSVGDVHPSGLDFSKLKTKRIFTKLDFRSISVPEAQLIDILKMCSESLQQLKLRGRGLTRHAYEAIANCTKLRKLGLERAQVLEDSQVEKIVRNNPDLETLSLCGCDSLTDSGLMHVRRYGKLRRIALSSCLNLTGIALRGLGMIPTLQHVEIDTAEFDTGSLRNIRCLKDLRILRLGMDMNPERFNIICDNFKKLEHLSLGCCDELTDAEGVRFRTFEHLKSLSFYGGARLTPRTFDGGLGPPAMTNLKLFYCPLTDAGLAGIAAHHGHLKNLKLVGSKQITDAAVALLFRHAKLLQELHIRGCHSLTDEFLLELEKFCPRLRVFFLRSSFVSIQGVDRFRSQRPSVQFRYSNLC